MVNNYPVHRVLRPIHKNGMRYAWLIKGELRKVYRKGYEDGLLSQISGTGNTAYLKGFKEGLKEYQLTQLLKGIKTE